MSKNRYIIGYICTKLMIAVKLNFEVWFCHLDIVLGGPASLVMAHQWCPGHPPRTLLHLQIWSEWGVGMRVAGEVWRAWQDMTCTMMSPLESLTPSQP